MSVKGLLVAVGLFASTGQVINFDSYAIGKVPPGWTSQWHIAKDQSAPTQPYVLASDSRSPLAILDNLLLRDGEVSVRLKPVAGHGEQAGGVVWRYRDPNNYYFARANAVEKNIAVFKVENGRRTALNSGVKHEVPSNGWCILKIAARGNHFEVYVDHRRILRGDDGTFKGAGRVGLWTGADSMTYFDDFRVVAK